MTPPDFSGFAEIYARSRPTYPAALFSHLAALAGRRELAWDCATGSGQAARGLAAHFERVIATDASAAQIAQAAPHPRIEYRVAPAERSGLEDGSVDLVTVAAAIHWFDLPRFYDEARRVTRPGGVLAAWTYHVARLDPPFGEPLSEFYRHVVGPYFDAGARLVDDGYDAIRLPGEPLPGGDFHAEAEWTCDEIVAFVTSWSGVQRYMEARGENPVERIVPGLERLCGGRDRRCRLRWPLILRAARL